jgi:hypothetical protein
MAPSDVVALGLWRNPAFVRLWIVAFGSAVLTFFFTLASVAVLPTIVTEKQLVEANARLHMSEAVLTLAGPSGAGFLVQLVTAPKAIIADVISYLVSAFTLGNIAATEVKPERRDSGPRAIGREIREGCTSWSGRRCCGRWRSRWASSWSAAR